MTFGNSTLLVVSGHGSPAALQQGSLTRPVCTERHKWLRPRMCPALVGAWQASRTPRVTSGYLAAGDMLPPSHKIPDTSTTFGSFSRLLKSGSGGRDRATSIKLAPIHWNSESH